MTKIPQKFNHQFPSSLSFFYPKDEWAVEKLEQVFVAIESLLPDTRIGWELKFIPKSRRVNGKWMEDHEYKNIPLGEDRLSSLEKIIRKTGSTSFWNGELDRLLIIHYGVQSKYLISCPDAKPIGYNVNISYLPGLLDTESILKTISQIMGAAYSNGDQSLELSQNLNYIDQLLRRQFDLLERFSPKYLTSEQLDLLKEMSTRLPHLLSGMEYADIRAVSRIHWMNYWSAETAAFYGFPDPEKDARLLPLAEQLPNGGWFFKLTAEPLDMTRADHREAVVWAYERFKPVGCPVEVEQKQALPAHVPQTTEELLNMLKESVNNLDPETRKKAEADALRFKAALEKQGVVFPQKRKPE